MRTFQTLPGRYLPLAGPRKAGSNAGSAGADRLSMDAEYAEHCVMTIKSTALFIKRH
jgi:hypothetical protein